MGDALRALRRLRHAARQTGRLRLPAAHHPLAQEHRPSGLHPAARRAVPRQCRGRDPQRAWCGAASSRYIIGLPANLFYGTGIPACILVIDKAGAASPQGHLHDRRRPGLHEGRPQEPAARADIHRIVDTFTTLDGSDPRYARMVGLDEIEKNDFNLNLPRYIDSSTPGPAGHRCPSERRHPQRPILQALGRYWAVCPQLRARLVQAPAAGYLDLAVAPSAIKPTIHQHPQFQAFTAAMNALRPMARVSGGAPEVAGQGQLPTRRT